MIDELKKLYNADDFVALEFRRGCFCAYIDGLVDSFFIGEELIKPITLGKDNVFANTAKPVGDLKTAAEMLNNGFCLIATPDGVIAYEAKAYPTRTPGDPESENVFKGARDGFVESLRTNTALVRRKIKNPKLVFKTLTVGAQTNTSVTVCHIDGVCNPQLAAQLQARLAAIGTDSVLTASQIEEYIADRPYSPFPQSIYTERADKFCAALVGGRAGLLVDGLPGGFILPGGLSEFMRAPEDYSQSYLTVSLVLILRYLGLFAALSLPALYLSLLCFHQEMLPYKLADAIIKSKQDVPFSSLTEVLGMMICLELLLEAGLRLPKPVGQTVSLVGALIVGSAAVEAGFVSPAVVIVVAMTGICGFTAPNQDLAGAVRLWRFALTLAGAFAGLFGVGVGLMILIYYLAGLTSLGVPYMAAYQPGGDLATRTIVRPPLFNDKFREKALKSPNRRRQK